MPRPRSGSPNLSAVVGAVDPVGVAVVIRAVRIRTQPARIAVVDRVVAGVPVQVDPASVPHRVARQEPTRSRIVIPLVQVQQARLRVRVVAFLPPVAERVTQRAGFGSVGVVQVGRQHVAIAVQSLGHVAPLVKGVEHAPRAARACTRVPGQEAAAKGVSGKHVAVAV